MWISLVPFNLCLKKINFLFASSSDNLGCDETKLRYVQYTCISPYFLRAEAYGFTCISLYLNFMYSCISGLMPFLILRNVVIIIIIIKTIFSKSTSQNTLPIELIFAKWRYKNFCYLSITHHVILSVTHITVNSHITCMHGTKSNIMLKKARFLILRINVQKILTGDHFSCN